MHTFINCLKYYVFSPFPEAAQFPTLSIVCVVNVNCMCTERTLYCWYFAELAKSQLPTKKYAHGFVEPVFFLI